MTKLKLKTTKTKQYISIVLASMIFAHGVFAQSITLSLTPVMVKPIKRLASKKLRLAKPLPGWHKT